MSFPFTWTHRRHGRVVHRSIVTTVVPQAIRSPEEREREERGGGAAGWWHTHYKHNVDRPSLLSVRGTVCGAIVTSKTTHQDHHKNIVMMKTFEILWGLPKCYTETQMLLENLNRCTCPNTGCEKPSVCKVCISVKAMEENTIKWSGPVFGSTGNA